MVALWQEGGALISGQREVLEMAARRHQAAPVQSTRCSDPKCHLLSPWRPSPVHWRWAMGAQRKMFTRVWVGWVQGRLDFWCETAAELNMPSNSLRDLFLEGI